MHLKKTILLVLLFFFFVNSYSQNCPSLSYENKQWLKRNGYSYLDYYDFSLQKGYYNTKTRNLYSTSDYIFIFQSESGVKDLDAYILSEYGTTLKKSTKSGDNGFASIAYTPTYTRKIKIKALNYSAYCNNCFYCVRIWIYYRSNS